MEFNTSTNTVTLARPEISALLAFVSTEKARANLGVAWFDLQQGYVEATDGLRALRASAQLAGNKADPSQPSPTPVEQGANPFAVPREFLARLQKLGSLKSQYRINFSTMQGEVWEQGVLQATSPLEVPDVKRPAFEVLDFEAPRTQGLTLWYVDVLLLDSLVSARLGYEAAIGESRKVKIAQIEAPKTEFDSLRATFGTPGEAHCWRVIIITRPRPE